MRNTSACSSQHHCSTPQVVHCIFLTPPWIYSRIASQLCSACISHIESSPDHHGNSPSSVHQLLGVVTFAYDLRFRRVIARWKGIVEEIHFGGSIMPSAIIENLDLKKPSFRPSKWPRKLKPTKNSKLPNCQKTVLSQ
jgi:hypothetical protein